MSQERVPMMSQERVKRDLDQLVSHVNGVQCCIGWNQWMSRSQRCKSQEHEHPHECTCRNEIKFNYTESTGNNGVSHTIVANNHENKDHDTKNN